MANIFSKDKMVKPDSHLDTLKASDKKIGKSGNAKAYSKKAVKVAVSK